MRRHIEEVFGALVIAGVLLAGPAIGSRYAHTVTADMSAQEAAIKEQRRQMAMAEACIHERGINSAYVETPDGFRCTDKHGRRGAVKTLVAEK